MGARRLLRFHRACLFPGNTGVLRIRAPVGQRRTIRHSAVDLVDAVLAVALAASCAACGELLEHPSRGPVCDRCWRAVDTTIPCVFGVSDAIADAQAIGVY